jgi:hypothetical protein
MSRRSAKRPAITFLGACTIALGACVTAVGEQRDEHAGRSPIKHVIVVIGENRSFDHVFATYRPRHDQHVDNLLSRGIVDDEGHPGPNFRHAAQFMVSPQASYFIAPQSLCAAQHAGDRRPDGFVPARRRLSRQAGFHT